MLFYPFRSWATVLTNTTSVTSSNRNYFVNAIQGLASDGGTSCELGLNKGMDYVKRMSGHCLKIDLAD